MEPLVAKVAGRFRYATLEKLDIRGGQRAGYQDAVWDMYRTSYQAIGMHLSGASSLLDYDEWFLFSDDEVPIAFACGKKTSYGWKLGVAGSDGSANGKTSLKGWLRHAFHENGLYGEVSEAIERITQGSPQVCAEDAGKILGKTVQPSADGVHYTRSIGDLGSKEKVMIGKPKGIPSSTTPACKTAADKKQDRNKFAASAKKAQDLTAEDREDLTAHALGLLFEDE